MVRMSNRVIIEKPLLERLSLCANRIGQMSNHFVHDLMAISSLSFRNLYFMNSRLGMFTPFIMILPVYLIPIQNQKSLWGFQRLAILWFHVFCFRIFNDDLFQNQMSTPTTLRIRSTWYRNYFRIAGYLYNKYCNYLLWFCVEYQCQIFYLIWSTKIKGHDFSQSLFSL